MIHSCEGMYTGFHLPQFQPSTMCYVGTVYHLVRVSGRTIFDLDARLGRSTVSTCGIGEGRDPGEMKASVHVVTTVCHVRGVGRSRRPCIAVCLRNLLSSRPRPDPALMDFFRKYYNQQQYLSFQKLICALKTCFWGPLGSGKLMKPDTLEGESRRCETKLSLSSDKFFFIRY